MHSEVVYVFVDAGRLMQSLFQDSVSVSKEMRIWPRTVSDGRAFSGFITPIS